MMQILNKLGKSVGSVLKTKNKEMKLQMNFNNRIDKNNNSKIDLRPRIK
jgi:hypothetical protein